MKIFKGFPICERHGITYKDKEGCRKCNALKKKPKEKPIDKAFREMEEKGLISKVKTMCNFCNTNKALEGDSYLFKPICVECLCSKSRRYKEQYDNSNNKNN